MADLILKKKEAKTVALTITDENGSVVDVSEATLTFVVKKNLSDSDAVITKNDDDFDKTDASKGEVSFTLTTEDTDRIGIFVGELKIYFSATDIDKSGNISLKFEEAITD